MKRLIPSLLATTLLAGAANADTALLIANSRYDEAQNLRDADEMTRLGGALGDAGFDTIVVRNGTTGALVEAISELIAAEEEDRVLIAVSGHFLRGPSDSWLMGREVDAPDLASVSTQGIALSVLMDIAARAPGRAVILLGFESRRIDSGAMLERGIGALDVPQGVTVIAGPPADLRDFAEDVLLEPAGDIAQAVADDGDLRGFGFLSDAVSFLDPDDLDDAPEQEPAPVGPPPISQEEQALWDAATELDTRAAYGAYMTRFPDGAYAREAEDRIAALEAEPVNVAEEAEAALGLNAADRQAIQRDLTILGFDTRGVDGIFGPGTRTAITNWQRRNSLEATGFLTARQVVILSRQADRRAEEIEAEEEERRAEEERADRAWWQATGQGASEEGLRSYLDRYPDGLYSDQAEAALADLAEAEDLAAWREAQRIDRVPAYRRYLEDWPDGLYADDARDIIRARTSGLTAQEEAEAQAREAALNLAPVARSLIEQRLAAIGADPGRVDGVFDEDFRQALRRYQRARGLPVTGYVDQSLVVRLMAEALGGRLID